MAQRKSAAPLVGVVMGSESDWDTMKHAAAQLDAFGVPYEARVLSAHRMPDDMYEYAEDALTRGLRCIVAGAGGAEEWDLAEWQPLAAQNHLRLGDKLRARGSTRAALAEYERALEEMAEQERGHRVKLENIASGSVRWAVRMAKAQAVTDLRLSDHLEGGSHDPPLHLRPVDLNGVRAPAPDPHHVVERIVVEGGQNRSQSIELLLQEGLRNRLRRSGADEGEHPRRHGAKDGKHETETEYLLHSRKHLREATIGFMQPPSFFRSGRRPRASSSCL